MKRKIVAGILTAAMAVSMFAGCGSTTQKQASSDAEATTEESSEDLLKDIIPKETVTLDVYDQLANYSGEQVGWFAKELLDRFNVKINLIPETDGTYDTRMESGNLGDIVIWGADTDQYQGAVKKGMLLDWEEDDMLSDYGADIKKYFPNALEKNRSINSDGKIHGFGHSVSSSSTELQSTMYTWDLRYDLYKKIGSPKITDLDSMVDCLAKMKEACPKDDNGNPTYGVSLFSDWDGAMVMFVKSTATAYFGQDEFGIGTYDPNTGKYTACLDDNSPYLQCLKFYNKLYQKGLLDPDSQTQGYDGMAEDYQNGTAFLNVFNFLGSALYNSDKHLSEGKGMFPVTPDDATPLIYGQSIYGSNRIWSIGENTEYPELCMAIINWLSTPEGFLTLKYGPQDVCWKYDNDGNTVLTDLGKKTVADIKTKMPEPYSGTWDDGSFKMNNETWALDGINPNDKGGHTFNYKNWVDYNDNASSDIEADWRSWASDQVGVDVKGPDDYCQNRKYVLSPGTAYTQSAKTDEFQTTENQVMTAIKDGSWKAIYAESDAQYDKIVSQMQSDAKAYGYDTVNKFYEKEAKLRQKAEQDALAASK